MSNLVVARPPAPNAAGKPADDEQFLTFHCASGFFGVGITRIKEILQYGQVTDVPLMPGEIRGVINLRGAVVPVIDLAVRFGKPAATIGPWCANLVTHSSNTRLPEDLELVAKYKPPIVVTALGSPKPAIEGQCGARPEPPVTSLQGVSE